MAASLQQHLSKIRCPVAGEKVYKDECVFSFDTPECETGLYVCMNTHRGFGKNHVERHFRKTGNAVYLHLRRIKKEIPKVEEDPPKKKPTKMAIGVEGGFDMNDKTYEYEELNEIVVLPDWTKLPVNTTEDKNALPLQVAMAVEAILSVQSAAQLEEAAAMAGTWDGEKRVISKHADALVQVDNGKKIPPSGWKCEMCDKTDNLWLNLSDGTILCGRRFWDGSGGNNHAIEYYEKMKYPLAVKLGTITADGGDVYSYDEDDMVEDPILSKHLAHFGINIHQLEKTDKTMAELEIDLNQRVGEWDVIQEAGLQLKPVYGPGYTGIKNLGNSCYMNSVMQTLFTVPDFTKKYADPAQSIFDSAPIDAAEDFNVQMAKFGVGLLSGDYSKPPKDEASGDQTEPMIRYQEGIRPQMFKTLIGRGHPEFSTKKQQDVQEFLLHLMNHIERNSVGSANPTDAFKYEMEERIQCTGSGKVRYTKRADYILPLPIPMEAVVNKEEVEAYEKKKKELEESKQRVDPKLLVRPQIPLTSCLECFSQPEDIDDFYSTALQAKSTAQKTTRLATFPDYLFIQLKKFTVGEDWVPKKLDISVDVPDELDLTWLRGHGLQAGEEALPEGEAPAAAEAPKPVEIDESVVEQLCAMGFAREGCRKAVYHTQNCGAEAAMNWVMEHMGDPDFADPLVLPQQAGKSGGGKFEPNPDGLAMLMSMGFTAPQATKALKSTDNNVERAADWIFTHMDELDTPMETDEAPQAAGGATASTAGPVFKDGTGRYKLVGFISHMGTSTMVGHYVCHLYKDGRWVIFNDEKVAVSEKLPKDLGYLYLYQRI